MHPITIEVSPSAEHWISETTCFLCREAYSPHCGILDVDCGSILGTAMRRLDSVRPAFSVNHLFRVSINPRIEWRNALGAAASSLFVDSMEGAADGTLGGFSSPSERFSLSAWSSVVHMAPNRVSAFACRLELSYVPDLPHVQETILT